MAELEPALAQIRHSLDQLSRDVSQGKYPTSILKDFKLTVDQLRLAIWAIIEFEDQKRKEQQGAKLGLDSKLVEFRIKRLVQMLADLHADIESGNITAKNPDLKSLSSTLQAVLQTITRVYMTSH